MKLFRQKFYDFTCKFSSAFSIVLTMILFTAAFIYTCSASDMQIQAATITLDNLPWNLLGMGLFLAVSYILWRISSKHSEKCSKYLLVLTLAWSLIVGCGFILLGKTIPAADSMSVFSMAEQLATGNTGVIHPTDSYISYYPQQIGLIGFYEILIRLWNLLPISMRAYPGIQFLNVMLVWVIIYFGYRTVKILWNSEKANCLYLMLAGANIPLFMYTSFVYGEIPSFAAISIGIYYFFTFLKTDKNLKDSLKPMLLSVLALSVGVCLRKNSLILIIAVLIVALLEYLRKSRRALLIYAITCLIGSVSILPLCESIYELRSGNTIGSGVTAMSYVAMGMQESSRGMGWYNGYNFNTYRDSNMNREVTNIKSSRLIKDRQDYFDKHPSYATIFYLDKFISQWTDGTYACRQATYAATEDRHPLATSLYEGDLSHPFLAYCNAYQNLLYLGALAFFLIDRKRKSPLYAYVNIIAVLGGFLFHTMWEANSRYIFAYGLLLLPYAAKGLDNLLYALTSPERTPQEKKQSRKGLLYFAGAIALMALLGACIEIERQEVAKTTALEELKSEQYNGVFVSMYPISQYNAEDFTTYRGVPTHKSDYTAQSSDDIADLLKAAFSTRNTVSNVYLGLDPAKIWKASDKSTQRWSQNLSSDLESFITDHPDTTFEIMLPYYSKEFWLQQSPNALAEALTTYQTLISTLDVHANTTLYFVGMEQWLIANADSYVAEGDINDMLAKKIMLYTFCDHEYQITAANAPEKLSTLQNFITAERNAPTTYADLSDYDIIFFGDSIFGNYRGSTSVPGVVSALSGARTYNCAKGGSKAADGPDSFGFYSVVDDFISGIYPQANNTNFDIGLREYLEDDHTGRKLVFVINYGLNDYFEGIPVDDRNASYDITTYAGALRSGCEQLRQSYPDATIVLMAPNYTTFYENGTLTTSEKGGVLLDYVNAAKAVSKEHSYLFMDNYHDLGIDEDTADALLEDDCHPNEAGRFLLGEHIIDKIDSTDN